METGMTSPRKYFVVVTHSATTQLELESVLAGGRYDNYDSAHASVYVEGLANFTSASELVARFSQHIERLDPPILKSDTRLVLAPLLPMCPWCSGRLSLRHRWPPPNTASSPPLHICSRNLATKPGNWAGTVKCWSRTMPRWYSPG